VNQSSSLTWILVLVTLSSSIQAQNRTQAIRGNTAIVVDERLSALRSAPALSGELLRRLGRGRVLRVKAEKVGRDGVVFYRVQVTRRTSGWIQREATIRPQQPGEDRHFFRLISASNDFDCLARAWIFLQFFPRSSLRPKVLLLYAERAEAASAKLSREAVRKLDLAELKAGAAPKFSYFLNYTGLDRYNRQGVRFVFDVKTQEFHYDGRAYREIVRRFPRSPEAEVARQRLQ
jgi:hypothetical protein